MSSASKRLSSLSGQIRSNSSNTMSRTMKEAVVSKGPKITIRDVPVPRPGPGQVVTKVVFSGCNPKDWKYPSIVPDADPVNQGDDIAGYVEEVGANVHEFKKGDRVAAFHEMRKPGGSYAEYALSWASTTWHLPENVSFEQGAAIPLAALTAVVGLYDRLKLPEPWRPAKDGQKTPLVIYGASSAVGAYVVQFARKSNIHPLICIAGRAKDHVESLIDSSKGDVYIDYRKGEDAIVQGIKDALKGEKLYHAYDAVSEKNSYQTVCKVLEPQGKITLVLPGKKYPEIPDNIEKSITTVGDVHGFPHDLWDLGFVYSKYIGKALQDGWFKPQPHEVIPGGLGGIEKGLTQLKDGTVSGKKYVYKIADTPGVSN